MIQKPDMKIKTAKFQHELIKLVSSHVHYLINKPFPLFQDRNSRMWTSDVEELLRKIMVVLNNDVDYVLFSMCFTGRSGSKVFYHYKQMLEDNKVETPSVLPERSFFDPYI